MTGFIVAAAILILIGGGFLLWPLLRRGSGPDEAQRAATIVSVYRDQLKELESERQAGRLEAERYEQDRRELERRLLEEVATTAPAPAAAPRPRRTAAGLAVLVVAVPVGLYLRLGTPDALEVGGAALAADAGAAETATPGGQAAQQGQGGAKPLTSAQVQKMIDGLKAELKQNPGDAASWSMLARAHAYLQQFDQAVPAYQKATELQPRDARLLADYADALAMANGHKLDGEPLKLIARALAIDPREVKSLALAGTSAFDHKDYKKAVEYWQRALDSAPNDPEFSQALRGSLQEARARAGLPPLPESAAAGGAGGGTPTAATGGARGGTPAAAGGGAKPAAVAAGQAFVRGRVKLAPALAAKARPEDVVFIFARAAQGPRMPLALLRRQVKDLPLEFALDDSSAMMPELTLSKFSPVIIGARISHTGDAKASSGDLQGLTDPVKVGTSGIELEINQVLP